MRGGGIGCGDLAKESEGRERRGGGCERDAAGRGDRELGSEGLRVTGFTSFIPNLQAEIRWAGSFILGAALLIERREKYPLFLAFA